MQYFLKFKAVNSQFENIIFDMFRLYKLKNMYVHHPSISLQKLQISYLFRSPIYQIYFHFYQRMQALIKWLLSNELIIVQMFWRRFLRVSKWFLPFEKSSITLKNGFLYEFEMCMIFSPSLWYLKHYFILQYPIW